LEKIGTTEAMKILKSKGYNYSLPTLIKLIRNNELGKKPVGQWMIDKERFNNFVNSKM
jgi:hypothetical protein